MRVGTKSNSGSVAGAIAGLLRSGEIAPLEVVGAGATYQAMCAVSIAGSFLKKEGIKPVVTITKGIREINGTERVAYTLYVKGEPMK